MKHFDVINQLMFGGNYHHSFIVLYRIEFIIPFHYIYSKIKISDTLFNLCLIIDQILEEQWGSLTAQQIFGASRNGGNTNT